MQKKPTTELTNEEFLHPAKEYRSAPFWAWNGTVNQTEFDFQIGEFQKMGFGGFFMHVRSGLVTPYLGKEFTDAVKGCVKKAKECNMLACLYDEDRWPSGFAGGLVTREHPEFRKKYLVFSVSPLPECRRFIGRFNVRLNPDGTLADYRLLKNDEPATDAEWFAQEVTSRPTPRYNNAGYADTLNPDAIKAFLDITFPPYIAAVGDEFGKTVPLIFTDEPQFAAQVPLPFSDSTEEAILPWTDDLPDTFAATFGGENLIERLPELIWNLPDDRPSDVRWKYHDHICERFVSAFSDQYGARCREVGLDFTGHVMAEGSLRSQSMFVGEAMRFYRSMTLPGIDMLCGYHEFTTAKQAQSAARQYGRAGMMSELYGVLGWDNDFRGHKHHGDWQAALGVTFRVPHLSLSSMGGEAKRDYPQSIHYQSSWYQKYPMIEDHFARVNTAMTRGTANVRIGVIHPIESYWLCYAVNDRNAGKSEQLESAFSKLCEWLLFGTLDFDYISESLLPDLCPVGDNPLRVGQCAYDVILVSGCETLRASTLERLDAFRRANGTLIFIGDVPSLKDAIPSNEGKELANRSLRIPFSRSALLHALRPFRDVEIINASDGTPADGLIYQLRKDGSHEWLFIAHAKIPQNPDVPIAQCIRIKVRGVRGVKLYDTMTGEIRALAAETDGTVTEFSYTLYDYDSLLFRLDAKDVSSPAEKAQTVADLSPISLSNRVSFSLSEPNVMLLDMGEYRLDGGKWQKHEEILRLDNLCRQELGWPKNGGGAAQPWCIPDDGDEHRVTLRFCIQSETALDCIELALEHPETTLIHWNGNPVSSEAVGFFVDHDIRKIALPNLLRGKNVLELDCRITKRIPLEWCYLLGNFGVRVEGREAVITPMPKTVCFGNIATQGFPFYGGEFTYVLPLETKYNGTVNVHIPQYRAAVLGIRADGGDEHLLAFSPYQVSLPLKAGKHTLCITAYLNRTNTFGPVHNADRKQTWLGPQIWRTEGDAWTYEYELFEEGILHAPILQEASDL